MKRPLTIAVCCGYLLTGCTSMELSQFGCDVMWDTVSAKQETIDYGMGLEQQYNNDDFATTGLISALMRAAGRKLGFGGHGNCGAQMAQGKHSIQEISAYLPQAAQDY